MSTETGIKSEPTHNKCKHCRMAAKCLPAQIQSTLLKTADRLKFKSILLKPGEHLYRQGEMLRSLFAIRSGILKSYTILEGGKEFIMDFHLPPSLFGWEGIDRNQLSVSVVAIDYSNVCEIPLETLDQLMHDIPEIRKQILQLASQSIHRQSSTLLRSSAEQRVTHFILSLAKQYIDMGFATNSAKLEMTHQDAANYLRMTPETISRTLKALQRKKLIHIVKEDIHLEDPQKLREIAGY